MLALLLALFLVPTAALQQTQAIADEVGTGLTVQGELQLMGYMGWDAENHQSVVDHSFEYGLNKVVIDMSQYGGKSRAFLRFNPLIQSGQDSVASDWNSIPDAARYSMDTIHLEVVEPDLLDLVAVTPDYDSATLTIQARHGGASDVTLRYDYVNQETRVHYIGYLSFRICVVEGPNEAIEVNVPSTDLTVWGRGESPTATALCSSYYYEYDCEGAFGYNAQEFMVACETAMPFAPATFSFDEIFDVSIADTSVVSAVYNVYRAYYINGMYNYGNGPDWRTYSLDIIPVSAGTTDVTFSLKQHPEKSVTVKVTVRADHPEAVAADHEMQVNSPQKIYVKDGSMPSNASPVYLPITAKYLIYSASWAHSFVKSLESSNADVVEVVPIANPNLSERFAPFEIIPLSVGTAKMTLIDCYDKAYTYTITVKPDPNESGDPSGEDPGNDEEPFKVESFKITSDGNDVTQQELTISTRDAAGRQLVADIVSNKESVNLTWASSNPSIAIVDENTGLVIPVCASYDEATGQTAECRIRVTANGEVTRYCNLIVEAPQGLCSADADSPLGAASIKLNSALSQDLLDELDTVALSVSPISSDSQDVVDSATSDMTSGGAVVKGVYDIHFVNKEDGSEHSWNKPQYPLTVQIPMDNEMREMYSHGTLTFYHIDPETGERTAMRTWVDKNLTYIYFETTHFSPFALVFAPQDADDDGDDDDDNAGNVDGDGENNETGTGNDGNNGDNGNAPDDGKGDPDNSGDDPTGEPDDDGEDGQTPVSGTSDGDVVPGPSVVNHTVDMVTPTSAPIGTTTVGSNLLKTGDATSRQVAVALLLIAYALASIAIANHERRGLRTSAKKE